MAAATLLSQVERASVSGERPMAAGAYVASVTLPDPKEPSP
jgi:hypothetical protein